jgi:hypothetical protein
LRGGRAGRRQLAPAPFFDYVDEFLGQAREVGHRAMHHARGAPGAFFRAPAFGGHFLALAFHKQHRVVWPAFLYAFVSFDEHGGEVAEGEQGTQELFLYFSDNR